MYDSDKRYYKVADLTLSILGNQSFEMIDILQGFNPFVIEKCDKPDIDIITDCTHLRKVHLENVEIINKFEVENSTHIFSKSKELYLFEIIGEDNEATLLLYKKDSNIVEIEACNNPYTLKFMLWKAFTLVALNYGVTPIHASTIVCKNQSTLFLGESGTGKSTHSQLWIKNIDGAKLLNDDSPMVRVVEDSLIVYGSPWSGKTNCYINESYKVKAFVRIKRGQINQIHKHNSLQSIGAIYPSFPPMFAFDEPLADKMLEIVSGVIKTTPIYTIACLPNAEAAQICYNELYENLDVNKLY